MSGPPIPNLPGYNVSFPLAAGDKTFYKRQTLSYSKGYSKEEPVKIVESPTTIKTKLSSGTGSPSASYDAGSPTFGSSPRSPIMAGTNSPTTLPKWVEQDRKVLRFYGYFKESVDESPVENHRIRKVIIYYYLEDDSLHVAEPKQDNSGIPQGVFIKRHRVIKDDGAAYNPSEFAVGGTATMYGRTFFIVDADCFTRDWYQENFNVQLSEQLGYPDDPVDMHRATFAKNTSRGKPSPRTDDLTRFVEAKLGKPPHVLEPDRLKQFLENNRKVLRFWCIWDDRTGLYGDRRPYVMHYFLENDTVEILEVATNNSGRDPFPVFLKRSMLPKGKPRITATGTTFKKEQCYRPEDFRLGQYIEVFGRAFFLHDCDGYTKLWYQENLGYAEVELESVDVSEPVQPLPKGAMPPYNGYGSLEDSTQNCVSLVPKPPKRDMHKLMNKDKIILRFSCKMAENGTSHLSQIDADRRFILSYFLMDDTLSIFEPPLRNSGIIGGKFLERSKVYKPKSEETFTYQDLYTGAIVSIHGRGFELLEADEYTYTYMENNKHIFVMADADAALRSLRAQVQGQEEAIRSAIIHVDGSGSGQLEGTQLEAALRGSGLKFTPHQVVVIRRKLDKERTGSVSAHEFLQLLGVPSA